MNLKRESLDCEPVHSFIHSPAPAHTLFYTWAIAAGGARIRAGGSRPDSIDRRSTRAEILSANRNPNGSTDELRPGDRRLLRETRRDVGGRPLSDRARLSRSWGAQVRRDRRGGRPAGDVKGSIVNGVRPTFKFWEDQHRTLGREDAGYVLVWYRAGARDNGCFVTERSC